MKSVFFLLVSIGLLTMADRVYGQDDGARKPLNNPMYSTHNYKHPNLAAAARRWENKPGVAVQQPAPGNARIANYKQQMPNAEPMGGITADHTPSTSLANRNYKIQRVSEPQAPPSPGEYYVKKPQRKADSTAVGD
jgi:hypothetical protein